MQIKGRIEGTGIPSQFTYTAKIQSDGIRIRVDDANNLAFWLEVVIPTNELYATLMGWENVTFVAIKSDQPPDKLMTGIAEDHTNPSRKGESLDGAIRRVVQNFELPSSDDR